jgi:hypothetical protein
MNPRSPGVVRIAEIALTTLGGTALAGALGLPVGVPLAIAAGISAGVNGAFGGFRQVYDWRTAKGWLAFAADSTWGLVGTTLGSVLHLVNLAQPDSGYRADLSRRRNRHWFDGGARLRRDFVLTLGNVVSNASPGKSPRTESQRRVIDRHEGLHIWQSRLFGPLYPTVYAAWFAMGLVVGTATWATRRGRPDLFRLVETAAYYDNPFEYWAYKRDGHWEDNRADPVLKWRRPRWRKKRPADGSEPRPSSSSPPTAPPAA